MGFCRVSEQPSMARLYRRQRQPSLARLYRYGASTSARTRTGIDFAAGVPLMRS